MTRALQGIEVVTLAPNVPGPVAAARLRDLGASVTKVESPDGDPLQSASQAWYLALHEGMRCVRLDLKSEAGRGALETLLAKADVLLTSSRIAALDRLGLGWDDLHARHPRLVAVAIVGRLPPNDDVTGHDLNYVGELGLLDPPALPRTLLADLAGAERAAAAVLELLLRRERFGEVDRVLVGLRESAETFALPWKHGLTTPGGWLGGGFAPYGIYRARDGWVAVASLEPHFVTRMQPLASGNALDKTALTAAIAARSVSECVAWAAEHDVPMSEVS